MLQPLVLVDLEVRNSERSSLQKISEINIHYPYLSIPYQVAKSSIALFINEILVKSLREAHPDDDLFLFLQNSLKILDLEEGSCANFHLCFMMRLSRYLGFFPQGSYEDDTPLMDLREGKFTGRLPQHPHYLDASVSRLFSDLLNRGYDTLSALRLGRTERKQLLQALIVYYQLHISGFGTVRSAEVLEQVAT